MTTLNKYARLAKAKAEFPAILKDTQAFGYKYAKLEQVIDATTPTLNKYGLDIMQTCVGMAVQTYLVDLEDGTKELVGDVPIDPTVTLAKMNVYQVMGSAISYFRRYELLAFLGLAQEDSDGAAPNVPEVDMNALVAKFGATKAKLSDQQKAFVESSIDRFKKDGSKLAPETFAKIMGSL